MAASTSSRVASRAVPARRRRRACRGHRTAARAAPHRIEFRACLCDHGFLYATPRTAYARCNDQSRRAAQTRILCCRDRPYFCCGRRRRQCAFGKRGSYRWLYQIPRPRDFSADIHARRVERVDHRGKSDAQVSGRRLNRGRGFRVAASGTGNQIVDRELGAGARHRGVVVERLAEVARERGAVGNVGFPAAVRPAGAQRAVERNRNVAELAGDVVTAAQQLAVNHDADAHAFRYRHEYDVAQRALGLAHRPGLRQRTRPAGVLDLHGKPCRGGERFAQVDIFPAERRRMQHSHGRVFDHARHDNAEAHTPVHFAIFDEQALDVLGHRGRQLARIAQGGHADDAGRRIAAQVGQHHERFARADVGSRDRAASRIDVQERGLPAADGLAGGAFENHAVANQVVDDARDGAAAHVHHPGEVGARNRLVRAHEVQHDAAVDLAGRAAGGDAEVGRGLH